MFVPPQYLVLVCGQVSASHTDGVGLWPSVSVTHRRCWSVAKCQRHTQTVLVCGQVSASHTDGVGLWPSVSVTHRRCWSVAKCQRHTQTNGVRVCKEIASLSLLMSLIHDSGVIVLVQLMYIAVCSPPTDCSVHPLCCSL